MFRATLILANFATYAIKMTCGGSKVGFERIRKNVFSATVVLWDNFTPCRTDIALNGTKR